MTVRFTKDAKADLQRIGDYIAKDNPQRALSFIDELEQKCLALDVSPKAFPLVARYERYGIRRRLHKNYLIFYRIDPDDLVILHILHGAQDYIRLLFGDNHFR